MIPDHIGFLARLEQHVADASAGGRVLGLVLAQIPWITRIDPLLGYHAGDEAARTATERLKQALRAQDEVYRIDRATLACVLRDLDNEGQAWAGAYRVLRTLEASVEIMGHSIHAVPVVSLALFPRHAADAGVLLQRASLALEVARSAREHVATYDPAHGAACERDLQLHTQLKTALNENKLRLFYQPQLDTRTGRIVSSEALTRWDHPTLGTVVPDIFRPNTDTIGWMPRLTHWLLHTCMREQQAIGNGISVSANLSAPDLTEPDLPELVAQALAAWHMPADRLTLEVTETVVMERNAILESNLAQLRQLGVRLSIDDFGTGYSSLARLKLLPVDELKIDGSFVREMTQVRQDERIVRSVIDLAHNLGIAVVAEGVEDKATLDQLTEMGCDLVQGFHISPPIDASTFADFVAAHQPERWARGSAS